jgi:amino acid transporter
MTSRQHELLIKLAGSGIVFAVCVLAVLLAICIDLAGNWPRPYERMRLCIEVISLVAVALLTVWNLLYRRIR